MIKNLNDKIGFKLGFDSYLDNKQIALPNLNIFKFIVEENNRRMAIYNTFL